MVANGGVCVCMIHLEEINEEEHRKKTESKNDIKIAKFCRPSN